MFSYHFRLKKHFFFKRKICVGLCGISNRIEEITMIGSDYVLEAHNIYHSAEVNQIYLFVLWSPMCNGVLLDSG